MTVLLRLLLLLVVVGCLPALTNCWWVWKGSPAPVLPVPPTTTPPTSKPRSYPNFLEYLLNDVPRRPKYLSFDYDVSEVEQDAEHLKILCRKEFDICYSTRQKMALFAVERLERSALNKKTTTHKKRLYVERDSELEEDQSSMHFDYKKNSDFNRGHLVPAGDMTSDESKLQTNTASNIYPQYKDHNEFAWRSWEGYTRDKAKEKGVLLVITGVFTIGRQITIDKFPIPKRWYKVLVWCEKSEYRPSLQQLQAEYIITSHTETPIPVTRWGSTQVKGQKQTTFTYTDEQGQDKKFTHTAEHINTVKGVENVIEQITHITFKISSSLVCNSHGPVARNQIKDQELQVCSRPSQLSDTCAASDRKDTVH